MILAFFLVSGSALTFLVVGTALVFVGSPILRRRRTRPIRSRDYPAWENWLANHYPKATKDEAEAIRRVVGAIAREAGVEPEQLLPSDRLAGFVLPTSWERFIGLDGESDFDLEIESLLDEGDVGPDERNPHSGEPSETVGDVIDFMLNRLRSPDNQPFAGAKK
ncbi:MAG TPA: hypothetical protein VGN57_07315 [Pirellulaceae bacterium]|nr:hypothetical protein [Pirellulaceae bacterium]